MAATAYSTNNMKEGPLGWRSWTRKTFGWNWRWSINTVDDNDPAAEGVKVKPDPFEEEEKRARLRCSLIQGIIADIPD